jgi:hypothetical protein
MKQKTSALCAMQGMVNSELATLCVDRKLQ